MIERALLRIKVNVGDLLFVSRFAPLRAAPGHIEVANKHMSAKERSSRPDWQLSPLTCYCRARQFSARARDRVGRSRCAGTA